MLPFERTRKCDFCGKTGVGRRVVHSVTTGQKALACQSCPNTNEECPLCADECPDEGTDGTTVRENEVSRQIVSALQEAVSGSSVKISYMAPSGKMHKIS